MVIGWKICVCLHCTWKKDWERKLSKICTMNKKACRLSISYLCLYFAMALNGLCIFYCFSSANVYLTLSQSLSFSHSQWTRSIFHSNETMPLLKSMNLSNCMWCICYCRLNRLQTAWIASTENKDRAIFKSIPVIAYEMDISNVCKNCRYLHCIVHWLV